ncbi:MAG: DUF3817 domain-containing protein [Microbacterium sp.]|uniref:DUF3817 domain-containing protein n=1 Tax=Microbacterium sp. TaxID=51671 RepID=UPI000925AB50|nr:DUF3817 domain-containing protein [Microbacterium sp.]MBN9173770.1 DUF3817 domain-containing protein [Microbacterium sp.]MBN9189094.1 DUF3817 domain-containing protein [Microbacterium sp.]MBN9191930.1 DUF3817 domain-containing protein [Microbacterium sp.]OJU67691.1 MAG: hypothetical protein BGO04_09995 [Microbacterium sp. 70-38]
MFSRPSLLFRTFAIAEAVSWTLLIAALVLRATTDLALLVTIAGGIHGFVFLCYVATSILVAKNNRWRATSTAVAIAAAIVPYATIPVEIVLHRRGRLAGDWRLRGTDDPRDHRWHDRLMRVLLRHPRTFAGIAAASIVVVFSVLLVIGPPGGRA